MKPMKVAYCFIGCFFVVERLLRKGDAARSIEEGQADRGSTRAIGATFGIALLALLVAPLLNWLKVGQMRNKRLPWGGIGAMVAGLMLRIWALRVLGAFYTRTLKTSGEQRLIEDGPYRLIRNPGYLGDLLFWPGAGFAVANWGVLAAILFPMVWAYRKRIQAEEAMLAEAFPEEFKGYVSRTWRLIPFVY